MSGGGATATIPAEPRDRLAEEPKEFRITPPSSWGIPDLREVLTYRQLIWFLAWRDVKVKYKQTAIGIGWAVVQPLTTTLVFTFVFSRIAHLNAGGLPYPVFVLSGLLGWSYFAGTVSAQTGAIADQQHLITKVYAPRLVYPLATLLPPLIDLAIGTIVLLALEVILGVALSPTLILLPLGLLVLAASSFAIGIWTSSLNVRYRDVRHLVPFAIQTLLLATPVVYPASAVPSGIREVLQFSPIAVGVSLTRLAMTGHGSLSIVQILTALMLVVGLASSGLVFFHRLEPMMADQV
jgi:lipopolysaccharide transport system permease protein